MNLSKSRLDVCEIRLFENVETTCVSGKIYRIFPCFNAKTSVCAFFLTSLVAFSVHFDPDSYVPS